MSFSCDPALCHASRPHVLDSAAYAIVIWKTIWRSLLHVPSQSRKRQRVPFHVPRMSSNDRTLFAAIDTAKRGLEESAKEAVGFDLSVQERNGQAHLRLESIQDAVRGRRGSMPSPEPMTRLVMMLLPGWVTLMTQVKEKYGANLHDTGLPASLSSSLCEENTRRRQRRCGNPLARRVPRRRGKNRPCSTQSFPVSWVSIRTQRRYFSQALVTIEGPRTKYRIMVEHVASRTAETSRHQR